MLEIISVVVVVCSFAPVVYAGNLRPGSYTSPEDISRILGRDEVDNVLNPGCIDTITENRMTKGLVAAGAHVIALSVNESMDTNGTAILQVVPTWDVPSNFHSVSICLVRP